MDWISDGLTRIRNGLLSKKDSVLVRGSKNFIDVLKAMKGDGLIKDYRTVDSLDDVCVSKKYKLRKQFCIVDLSYVDSRSVIRSIKRISKGSRRVYIGVEEIRHKLSNMIVPIVSTSKGVVSGRFAVLNNVGGELVCEVF